MSSYSSICTSFSPEENKGCIVVFADECCGFVFCDGEPDANRPRDIECRYDVRDLVRQLGTCGCKAPDNAHVDAWIGMELLRRFLLGWPLPSPTVTGIERHFREVN